MAAELKLINLNVTGAVHLAKRVLPDMITAGRGGVLFTSTIAATVPGPYDATYAASKAFLLSFSSALQSELKGTGVTVTVFCPGVTQTEFRSRAGIGEKRKDSGMTAQAAARIARAGSSRSGPKCARARGTWRRDAVHGRGHEPVRAR